MIWGIVIAGLTIAFSILSGWLRGGDIQMAKIQVQGYLQLLAAAYLFGVSLRGPRDYRIAGRLIVAAACIKAAMAIWIRFTLPSSFLTSDGVMTEMAYATSHGDSLLFACAIIVLFVPLLYRPRARQLRWVLLTLPLIVAGLFANDRRIAWVQIALGLVVLVGMNLRQVLTRRLVRHRHRAVAGGCGVRDRGLVASVADLRARALHQKHPRGHPDRRHSGPLESLP